MYFSVMKREKVHYCGECSHFCHEDVYGVGCCQREGCFDVIRFCDQPCCEDFELEED